MTDIVGFVLLLDKLKQPTLGIFHAYVFLVLDYALQLIEGVYGDNIPAFFHNVLDNLPIMHFIVEIRFDKKDIDILELRVTFHIDCQVNLVHLCTDEQNSCAGILSLHIGEHIKDYRSLADTGVADNHVVNATRQPSVAAQQIVERCATKKCLKEIRVETQITHSYHMVILHHRVMYFSALLFEISCNYFDNAVWRCFIFSQSEHYIGIS